MSLVDNGNGNGMVMPVAPMTGNGYGYGNGGSFGDGFFWLIILFLFAFVGNGWGNGFGGGNPATVVNNDVQRGFDQSALINGINGVQTSLTTGFAAAESAEAARQMANMQQSFAMQTALANQLNGISMTQQNCCCENRAAIADVKYAIANDGATTRSAISAGNQQIMDKLCQLELDGIKQNYENRISGMQNTIDSLRSQIGAASDAAARTAQTAQIIANNEAQTAALENYLNPPARPAWIVNNPNCCSQQNSCGCGFAA